MDRPDKVSAKGAAPLIIEPVVALTVHDGDTFRVSLPMYALIPGATPTGWTEDVRLAHVNAAELPSDDGKAARDAVTGWLAARGRGRLHVWGREKYGRLLADYESLSDGALLSTFVGTLAGTGPESVARQLVPES